MYLVNPGILFLTSSQVLLMLQVQVCESCFGSKKVVLCWSQVYTVLGFPGGSDSKESASNAGDLGLIPGSGRAPAGGHGNPLQYSCLEKSRRLVGYSSWGHKEPDMTESTNTVTFINQFNLLYQKSFIYINFEKIFHMLYRWLHRMYHFKHSNQSFTLMRIGCFPKNTKIHTLVNRYRAWKGNILLSNTKCSLNLLPIDFFPLTQRSY